ncbi:MAG TPA: patatin-like phospholipase family protein [Thermoleophilaceae bacterium]|nr:patatin-like phospholipase family protein [Thermoleophilaceae bacterium]
MSLVSEAPQRDLESAGDALRNWSSMPGDELFELARVAQAADDFTVARRLYARARKRDLSPEHRSEARHQHAVCTYRDTDVPAALRLRRALEILDEIDGEPDARPLAQTNCQETLGIAGGIHKRRWEIDGSQASLQRSLAYYRRGYEQGPEGDQGYTGINAAFVLDLLADMERRAAETAGAGASAGDDLERAADEIRRDLIARLEPLVRPEDERTRKDWWLLVTIAEAHLGLRHWEQARRWLESASRLEGVRPQDRQTTVRQIGALARLHGPTGATFKEFAAHDAGQVVLGLLSEEEVEAAWSGSDLGKVGLALSGGGFRASFFHIGVLAHLAERDFLRHVEVLSCVSGGSILGAHYYLALQEVLEQKSDRDVTREDYLRIVESLVDDFTDRVTANIRLRAFANAWCNLRSIFDPGYTRTSKAGDLYEKHLYPKPANGSWRHMDDLLVTPRESAVQGFNPKRENWRRRNKVPVLVLNATTLNTGRNWQFTATWMGEPPPAIENDVDVNERLRRMYYWQAPPGHREVRLGHAVAASACVPGVFEPLVMRGVYPDRTLALVDGGVHDNQGTASLIEQDCSLVVVSDASGQLDAVDRPGGDPLDVALRSSGVQGARVREAQYRELAVRRSASALRGLVFVHLRKGLTAKPIDWDPCDDPWEGEVDALPTQGALPGEVSEDVQRALAAIRTDLDSFSEAEAYALMAGGYLMARRDFQRELPGAEPEPHEHDWKFRSVIPAMCGGPSEDKLLRILRTGERKWLKAWQLSRAGKVATAATLIAFVAVVAASLYLAGWDVVRWVLVGLLGLFAAGTLSHWALGRERMGDAAARAGIGIVLLLLSPLATASRLFLDRFYLRAGRVPPDGDGREAGPASGRGRWRRAAEDREARPESRVGG